MCCAWFAMFDARGVVLYLIARYCRVAGKGITRTRLMKLLFLVDYMHWKRCGRKLTNLEWRTYLFGPFSREVLDILDELEADEKVRKRLAKILVPEVVSEPELRFVIINTVIGDVATKKDIEKIRREDMAKIKEGIGRLEEKIEILGKEIYTNN